MRSRFVLGLAIPLVILGTLACSGGGVSTDVVVAGNKAWTPTGVALNAGQTVIVKASGEVFANDSVKGGPDGVAGHPEWSKYNVVPDANHVALIGKIGEKGKPFLVGASFSQTVTEPGQLFLGPNDKDTSNDKGQFKATVTVK